MEARNGLTVKDKIWNYEDDRHQEKALNFFKLMVKCMNLFLQLKIILITFEIVLFLLDQILIKMF